MICMLRAINLMNLSKLNWPRMGGWVMYQDAAARIAGLEAALKDMAKHIWRGDWDKLKPETRAILEPKK